MISGKVSMVPVPRDWVAKPYVDYFDHLLWTQELLACGIYRKGEYKGPRAKQLEQALTEAKEEDPDMFDSDEEEEEADDTRERSNTFGTEDGDEDKKKKTYLNYVYTSPPGKSTLLLENDRIICFTLSSIVQVEREVEAEKALE